jgi:hypothetical protein
MVGADLLHDPATGDAGQKLVSLLYYQKVI